MADHAAITRLGAAKAPTSLLTHFPLLLEALSAHIAAERDLDATGVSEPSWPQRLHLAEEAQTRVHDLLSVIRREVAGPPSERPLRRMAIMLDAMTGAEEPGRFGDLYRNLALFLPIIEESDTDAADARVAGLLAMAKGQIDDMAGLSVYRTGPFGDEAPVAGGPAATEGHSEAHRLRRCAA